MSGTIAQRHWYDGLFYAVFIDSRSTDFRDRLLKFVTPEAHFLDIGCGTGGFTLKLAQ